MQADLNKIPLSKLRDLAGDRLLRIPNSASMSKEELIQNIILYTNEIKLKEIPTTPQDIKSGLDKIDESQLKQIVERRGIKYAEPRKTNKETLIHLLTADSCDAEQKKFCKDESQACDMSTKLCVTDDMKSPDMDEMTYRGHKIIGSPESLQKLRDTLESSKRKLSPQEEEPRKAAAIKSSSPDVIVIDSSPEIVIEESSPEIVIEESSQASPVASPMVQVAASPLDQAESSGEMVVQGDSPKPFYNPQSPQYLREGAFSPVELELAETLNNDEKFFSEIEIEQTQIKNVDTIRHIKKCLGLL
jgi:hypothetical protein